MSATESSRDEKEETNRKAKPRNWRRLEDRTRQHNVTLSHEDVDVRYSRCNGRVMTIDENDSPFEDRGARGDKEDQGAKNEEKKNRKKKEEKKRARGRKETGCTDSPRDGVPQTETHSPELCNSLLKQSHPGTLSSLHPASSPASAPDPSEPPERARTL